MRDRRTSDRRRRLIRGGGFGGGGSLLPAIVLTWTTGEEDDTPTMTIDVPEGVLLEDDHWEIRFYSDIGLTTQIAISEGDVNATDAGDGEISDTLSSGLGSGTRYARALILRDSVPITQYSNVEVKTLVSGETDDDDYAAWLAAA